MAETKFIKTSLRLTGEMHEWYKAKSEEVGIPMNAMIIFAMLQYQREETVLPNLPEMLKAMVDFNVNVQNQSGSEQVPNPPLEMVTDGR